MCRHFQRFLTNQRKVLEYAEYFAFPKRKSVRQYGNQTAQIRAGDEWTFTRALPTAVAVATTAGMSQRGGVGL